MSNPTKDAPTVKKIAEAAEWYAPEVFETVDEILPVFEGNLDAFLLVCRAAEKATLFAAPTFREGAKALAVFKDDPHPFELVCNVAEEKQAYAPEVFQAAVALATHPLVKAYPELFPHVLATTREEEPSGMPPKFKSGLHLLDAFQAKTKLLDPAAVAEAVRKTLKEAAPDGNANQILETAAAILKNRAFAIIQDRSQRLGLHTFGLDQHQEAVTAGST